MAAAADPQLTWDVVRDVRQLFDFPFMVHALVAGTMVAVLAGLVGWFMVLRRQSFAGHSLAVVGFPGAAGAVLVGLSATFGYFVFAVTAALVIALVPTSSSRRFTEESAVTGAVQAFALGCGYLFVTLYGGFLGGTSALLFGSFLGITSGQVLVLAVVTVMALGTLAAVARPLLFASIDADVAQARTVPVRALSVLFLLLLGVTAAAVSQITGTLLVFALLVLPPATARAVSARPVVSASLSVTIGVAVMWSSLFVAYYTPYPIGFYVTTFSFALFCLVAAGRRATSGSHRGFARAAS